jgi:hypothetical protein
MQKLSLRGEDLVNILVDAYFLSGRYLFDEHKIYGKPGFFELDDSPLTFARTEIPNDNQESSTYCFGVVEK